MRTQGSTDKLEWSIFSLQFVLTSLYIYSLCLLKSDILELSIVLMDACVLEKMLTLHLISVSQFQFQPRVPQCVPGEWHKSTCGTAIAFHCHLLCLPCCMKDSYLQGFESFQYLRMCASTSSGNRFSDLLLDRSFLWFAGPGVLAFSKEA